MSLALQPRQRQSQTTTPAMMMAISLLQLPIADLRAEVKKEVESNPALEIDLPVHGARGAGWGSGDGDKEGFLENVADTRGETLGEHLMAELRMAGVAGRELELCQAIVADLDADGRFQGEMPTLQMTLSATAAELEAARQKVMAIDPQGCGARDLAECYCAQLGQIPASKRAAAEKAVDELAAVLGSGKMSSFRPSDPAAFLILKKLNPFPGRQYDSRKIDFVIPDVRVDARGNVTVDQGDIPELRISAKYVEMAKDRELDAETRAYAQERVKRARDFREALVRRREAMEVIAEEAVGGQADFLAEGVAALRRQTMSDVAKKAKCDVSTVSRAAARKYVKTPHGTLPLRKFFSLVDQAPIEHLRAILAACKPGERPSDRELAERMTREGFPMARRTVAKYRVRLGFL